METDNNGQPLRRLLMCGFLESLTAVEDNADDTYLPLGQPSQTLLTQATSAYANYIANHDAGDASIGATPGATHDHGCNAKGGEPPDAAQDARRGAARRTRASAPGEAPTPGTLRTATPISRRRRPKGAASTAATSTRAKKPREPTKLEHVYSLEELITAFTSELRVAVDLDARMGGDDELEGGCVHGANIVGFVEAFYSLCVWTALLKGTISAFCSCGGAMGSGSAASMVRALEHVEIQWKRKKSSTCRHAAALLTVHKMMSAELGMRTLEALMTAVPALSGPDVLVNDKPDETVIHFVGKVGRRMNIPLYAISYGEIWSPAIVRRGRSRYKLDTCCLFSCQSQL
eukprot:TRINITY_DN5670_c0_g1_i1.p1 TRINITY_DN5670_c0_g1~~TRINITY_DN5670_c0_g1_i1.p1  ORF type:complete len:346 (+),score=24.02 TRINITY_DN5670_c0_g1_i1:242-1279(+)